MKLQDLKEAEKVEFFKPTLNLTDEQLEKLPTPRLLKVYKVFRKTVKGMESNLTDDYPMYKPESIKKKKEEFEYIKQRAEKVKEILDQREHLPK